MAEVKEFNFDKMKEYHKETTGLIDQQITTLVNEVSSLNEAIGAMNQKISQNVQTINYKV